MAFISITTPQNIELEYQLASLGDRILAGVIDLLIIIGYCILINIIVSFSGDVFGNGFGWLYVLVFLPVVFYSLVSEILLNGQSVGKKVMNIKVISLNGDQASFSQYIIRWLFRLVDCWLFSFVPAVITVALTNKHQRIGDLVAGTTLVKTNPRTSMQQTIFVPDVKDDYVVHYAEAINLSDRDMQLVKEVLLNVHKTGNTMLALQTMQRVEQVLHIRSHHEDAMEFLKTLLKDYNHLTSKM